METFVAFDLGAESGRAIAGVLEGEKLTLDEVCRFPNGPVRVGDALHWDVLRLWSEMKNGLALCAQKHGQIASVGVDTWGVDFALLDRNDELAGNPRHYRDPRNEGMPEEAFKRVSREEIFESTGIQFMRFNSLYQLLAMRHSESSLLASARTFLMMPDLFNFWLTGRKACEFTIATTSQCYDPRSRQWALPILQRLHLPHQIFGEVIAPGTELGRLLPAIADECGLGGGHTSVVAPACHDTGSAVAAVPASEGHWAYLSSGTWSLMGIEVSAPIIDANTLALNVTNEGGVMGTTRLLKNIMGLWLIQECKRAWARSGEDLSYADLTRLADEAPPLTSLINPDDPSFIAPDNMPEAIRAYCERTNQKPPEDRGAIVRCALESLALKYREVLGSLDEIASDYSRGNTIRHDPIHVVGGGSQNELLNQWTADACERTVIAGPIEATAIGNVLMQAYGLGRLPSLAAIRTVVRGSFPVRTYTPSPSIDWDDAYGRWQSIVG